MAIGNGKSLYDLLAVNTSSMRVRVIAAGNPDENREAILIRAVARQGRDGEFFAEAPAGIFKDGDLWTAKRDCASCMYGRFEMTKSKPHRMKPNRYGRCEVPLPDVVLPLSVSKSRRQKEPGRRMVSPRWEGCRLWRARESDGDGAPTVVPINTGNVHRPGADAS